MEDSKLKTICLLFLLILFLLLTYCRQDTTQLAKDEFSKYYNGKDEVVLNIEDNLYFENHILENESLNPKNSYGSIVFHENLIYYVSINSLKKKYRNEFLRQQGLPALANAVAIRKAIDEGHFLHYAVIYDSGLR